MKGTPRQVAIPTETESYNNDDEDTQSLVVALLATESLTEAHTSALFASKRYLSLTSALGDARSAHVALLFDVRSKYPHLFHDPCVFHLAVAYMDRVMCHARAFVTLKVSNALPMACLLISIKFVGVDTDMGVKELARAGGLSTKVKLLVAEVLVLEALEWNLNLITPVHYALSLRMFEALKDDLDLLCACLPWGSVPHLKPSVLAAVLTEHPSLACQCAPAELALARETLFARCGSSPK